MGIVNPSSFADMMATRPIIAAEGPFSIAEREGRALGAQLAGQAMEGSALLKAKQMELDYFRDRDKDLAKINRRNSIINALTAGLGSFELVGGGGGRKAGDAFNDALVAGLLDPSGSLKVANDAQNQLNQYRVGMLPSIAGSSATAAGILRSAVPS